MSQRGFIGTGEEYAETSRASYEAFKELTQYCGSRGM